MPGLFFNFLALKDAVIVVPKLGFGFQILIPEFRVSGLRVYQFLSLIELSTLLFLRRFSAIARFTYGPAQGCGGRWDIRGEDTTEIQSHDEDGDGNYEPELNCQWVLLGDPGKVLKLTFTASSFNIERDSNATSVTCWDYVEVRDGFSPFPL